MSKTDRTRRETGRDRPGRRPVPIDVPEQPVEVRLARPTTQGIVGTVVIGPGRARTRPVQFHGPGAEHVSCENGQPVFSVHERCVAAVMLS